MLKKWTCFIVSESGNVIYFVERSFENHKKLKYRKSRGLIVLDLILRKNYLQPYKILIYKILNLLL